MNLTLFTVAMTMLFLEEVKADVQPQKNFDVQRFAGKWYRVGLAYDSPSFVPYRNKLTISMGIVNPQSNGNVNMTMWGLSPTGCQSIVYMYQRTPTPGVFNYYSTRHHKMKDVTVVETNYTEYAIVFKYKKMNREYSQVSLYGRTQKLRPELIQKFRTFSESRGFPRESILIPPASPVKCPPSDN